MGSNFPLAGLVQSNIPPLLLDFLGGSHGPTFNSGVSGKADIKNSQLPEQMTLKLFSTERAGKTSLTFSLRMGIVQAYLYAL